MKKETVHDWILRSFAHVGDWNEVPDNVSAPKAVDYALRRFGWHLRPGPMQDSRDTERAWKILTRWCPRCENCDHIDRRYMD